MFHCGTGVAHVSLGIPAVQAELLSVLSARMAFPNLFEVNLQ